MAGGAPDANDGSKAARFKALALPHLDEVYTLARYLLRSASDADDAVQECYLRAFRHFDTFRGGPIKPWLMAILRNTCRAAYGSNAHLVYTVDNEQQQVKPIWREDEDTPEQSVIRRHEAEAMQRLIEDLPAEFKEVVVLREINDLSYRDIATVIDAPIGTVMSRLARGRQLLRAAWIAAESQGETP
ncbi:MAG: RNA polymerase subunit sigma [Bradyrhizobium sp. 35-63-5]|nr:MAG: RNA polymerase subunit sigma [Bradyrhizobium sp. 35-63-5]